MFKLSTRDVCAFLLLILLAGIISTGMTGLNTDICSYRVVGTTMWRPIEFVGGYASTLTIDGVYLGVVVVTSWMVLGLSLLTRESSQRINSSRNWFMMTAALLLTWPIHTYATNALRAGMCLGSIALVVASIISERTARSNVVGISAAVLMLFSHKLGILIGLVFLSVIVVQHCLNRVGLGKMKKILEITVLGAVSVALVSFSGLHLHSLDHQVGRSLGGILPLIYIPATYFIYLVDVNSSSYAFIRGACVATAAIMLTTINNSTISERLWPVYIILYVPFLYQISRRIHVRMDYITLGYACTGILVGLLSGYYADGFKYSMYTIDCG